MSDPMEQYKAALISRRRGGIGELGPDTSFVGVKPDFYADARVLSEDALAQVFGELKESYPPYGVIREDGSGPLDEKPSMIKLAMSLSATGRFAIEKASPSVKACPYHETIAPPQLGGEDLEPYDNNERGLDTLRSVVAPGAMLNSPLFVSLVKRMPAIQRLHGDKSDPEVFTRASVSLLREPLGHPQQWAKAFVYSLGTLATIMTDDFFDDYLAKSFTRVEENPDGRTRLGWSRLTEDLLLLTSVTVKDRSRGPEIGPESILTKYPKGTRLGDIKITEPTIGCPGDQLARAMWDRTIDVFVGESLWDR